MQTEHKITSAVITNDVLSVVGYEIDVAPNIVEYNFYQNLQTPYVHGTIVLVDDQNLRGTVQMTGTEKITITMAENFNGETREIFSKRFVMVAIKAAAAINERADSLVFHIIEEHNFTSNIKRISKSYTGFSEQIVKRIMSEELGRETVLVGRGSAQGPRKLVVPYLQPIEAAAWVLKNATTSNGFPLFVFGNLYNDTIYIDDLETILDRPVNNPKLPLLYTITAANTEAAKISHIKDYMVTSQDDLLKSLSLGVIGSSYSITNIDNGTTRQQNISSRNILQQMKVDNLIDEKFALDIIDPMLQVDGKLYDQYPTVNVHQVESGRSYPEFNNYTQEQTPDALRMKSHVIRELFNRKTIQITMDAFMPINRKLIPSNKINILFPDKAISGKGGPSALDKKLTGTYMITSIHHEISRSGSNTSRMTLVRVDGLA